MQAAPSKKMAKIPFTDWHMRRWLLRVLLIALLLIGVALVLMLLTLPLGANTGPGCVTHTLFGFYCPSCGMTRAVHQLFHGHVAQSLRYNLFALPLLVIGSWQFLCFWLEAFFQRRLLPYLPLPWQMMAVLAGLMLLYGALRNISVPPFSWLAPTQIG
jgi:hypothetical protein